MNIKENELLAPYTNIGLGGSAKYLAHCQTVNDVIEALQFARDKQIRTHILGGGSNTIFADEGFDGLVLKVELMGVSFDTQNEAILVKAGAGEIWDNVVDQSVERCLAGIECMSGIPGQVGALPVQNVGAYGQQVSDTISAVAALDTQTLETINFSKDECGFDYRTSRFKTADAGRYIIIAVTFRLEPNGQPRITYPDLLREMGANNDDQDVCGQLKRVRQAVLDIRGKKSMLVVAGDANSKSCGSFFTNIVLSAEELADLRSRSEKNNVADQVAFFPAGEKFKVSAAWLIEHAGFYKGQRSGGVGISEHHVLALVNHAGTTRELLAFASDIQKRVKEMFGVQLELEPILVKPR